MKHWILVACGATLAGCGGTTEVSRALVVPDKVTCIEPYPERNAWLRDEHPPLEEVVAAYHRRGYATQESRVYRSYKAWQDAGRDHVKAAEYYGPGYLAAAACWT
ncbi:hypothetical protein [Pseudaestuariivita atlantica]|uniref:Lipoprotein n=1 Tax=Pseudaestuariivita atlantica TaxID=1317121 RepID=A0A0L1JW10_9RHOB|nr:hypothetical protein [Pseudaestuariivita atlantica]KNG95593.1 hypothetical protein ATO11_03150 [Pseudaestuariivita atlantica]